MQHLATPHELLEATFRERWRRGWAAVAPELEPYLDTQRWPSGLPLPEDLRANTARHIRPPQWLPDLSFCMWMLALFAYLHFFCVRIMSDPRDDDGSATPMCGFDDNPNYACRPCIMLGLLVVSVSTLIAYGIVRKNQAVPQHVNSLYVLYALERTDPDATRELICSFMLRRRVGPGLSVVNVFADGTYDIGGRFIGIQPGQHGVAQYHSPQQQEGGAGAAEGEQFAAGTENSAGAERRLPPAAGDDMKAHLLPDGAV